jgi:hypothetical protein
LCLSSPCSPHGVCIPATNSYTCTCNIGYGGLNCQSLINYCNPNPCINGNCTQLVGSYACVCPAQYAGPRCEIYSSACAQINPCKNNAICSDDFKVKLFLNIITRDFPIKYRYYFGEKKKNSINDISKLS